MKKFFLLIILSITTLSFYSQNLSYVTFTSGLNDLAAYATLYNTQNSRNDSMHVQRFRLSDFSMSGTKIINTIKGRFINPSSTPNNNALADLVIYDMNSNGQPGNLLHSVSISVSNTPNTDGTTYKDITTNVPSIEVTDNFFVGIRTSGADVVQFYVGNTGCGCDNAWLYGPTAINAGDDAWRTLISRHAAQDLNYYFEVNVSNLVTNQAPTTANDVANTLYQTPVNIDVLANDSDSDGTLNNSSVTVTVQPANGTTSVNTSTGAITYTPNNGFSGVNTFTYQVCDNGSPALCSTGTVTVSVSGLSINENEISYKIYPNPTYNSITIETDSKIEMVTFIDLRGKTCKKTNSSSITTNDLNPGIYQIVIALENGTILKDKVVIQ